MASIRVSTSFFKASTKHLRISTASPLKNLFTPYIIIPFPKRTMATKALPTETQSFLDAIKGRRSTYTLSKESTISDEQLKTILETALEETPSTFGSFTTRIVLAVKEEHQKLWDLVIETVKAVTPPEKYESSTKARLEGFKNSYGTVLFFEDPENTRKLQDNMPPYKDHFTTWSQHTNAMHQYAVWVALTTAGLGANLQHYNPLIDEKVKTVFDIPSEWFLTSQLTFGKPTAGPGPKPRDMKAPMEQRLLIRGADA